MRPWPLILTYALAALGCMTQPPGSLAPNADSIVAVQPSPMGTSDTVPFAPWPTFAAQVTRAGSEQLVIESVEDFDRFLTRHPAVAPTLAPGLPSPHPALPPYEPRKLVAPLDFGKYRGVLVFQAEARPRDFVKIVRIEEQADRFLVHATHFTYDGAMGEASTIAAMDFVGLPRTAKAIAFAPIASVTLRAPTPAPSPLPGAPASPLLPPGELTNFEHPTWKAIPNPEITQERLEASLRQEFAGSRFERVSIERRTLDWVRANLNQIPHPAWGFSLDSEVWVVTAVGDLIVAGNSTAGMPSGTRVGKVLRLVSIDRGSTLLGLGYEPGTK